MKKKIAILGSTGSIGKTLYEILKKEKKDFEIKLLTANKNHHLLLKQAKEFKVKNLIITDKKSYEILKLRSKNLNINIFNDFSNLKNIFKKKIDYTMCSITGIQGLSPTLKMIQYTKKIAIANKESIICGWNLINLKLKKNKTIFVPVDSEHFSIWFGMQGVQEFNIDKIFLTASGGPLYNVPLLKFKNISISKALNHPNWKMGRKISIDSATMVNKVYEIIEAKKIFNIDYKKIKVLIHPNSYIHALLKFNNGLIKIIAHDTTMKIPIFNTLFFNTKKTINSKKININLLNDLNFNKVDNKRYPMINLLNLLPKDDSLYETVVVSANDTLVDLFLKKKINFTEIHKKLFDIIKMKEFVKLKRIKPNKISDILNLNQYVRLKTLKKVYKNEHV